MNRNCRRLYLVGTSSRELASISSNVTRPLPLEVGPAPPAEALTAIVAVVVTERRDVMKNAVGVGHMTVEIEIIPRNYEEKADGMSTPAQRTLACKHEQ
eukprot:933852-Prorocentrum_minimum.AAC.1